MTTVRHWPHSYGHDHEGADTVAALDAARECAGIDANDMTVRMMAVQLEIKGQSTYVGDNGNQVFRLVE